MKKIFHLLAVTLLMGSVFTACSPDEFAGANQNDLPTVQGVDFNLVVDQEANQITATYPVTNGVYPIWLINGSTYSTLNEVNWSNKKAGTYDIELRLANRNGISQASVKKSFTFEKTLVDWGVYYDRLNGKTWRIKREEVAHLACGPSKTDGTSWWKANPNDKADWGVYDDVITFNFKARGEDNGTYSYNPGEGGTMYINKGATQVYPDSKTKDEDYTAQVSAQTVDFRLEAGSWVDESGKTNDCTYLVLAPKTNFPYIANNEQWNEGRFRIEKFTDNDIDLVVDNNSIAWHYKLTSKPYNPQTEPTVSFGGYKWDSACNLFKTCKFTNEFYYAPGWTAIDPMGFEDKGNGEFLITLPQATTDQWQAQVKFLTDMTSNAATKYDFSIKFVATQAIPRVTVKLYNTDDNFYFVDTVELPGGETVVHFKDNFDGKDFDKINLVLDFGGAPANTEVTVKDIVFKEHDCDDGAGHPTPAAQ